MQKSISCLILLGLILAAFTAWAETPNVLSSQPKIHATDRTQELDEILWSEDFEGDLTDWEFIDGNSQEVVYWQTSDYSPETGNNWRCYDPTIGPNGGYNNHWLQWLNSPEMDLSAANGATLSFDFRLICETPNTAEAPYDGWDAANVWASGDGGETWEVIEPATGTDYNISSAYSFGSEWLMGAGIAGWGGTHFTTWTAITMDLTPYVGNDNVRVRFAFCSDPADCSAEDHPDWTGFQVDNIVVTDNANNVVFSDDADGNNVGGDFTFSSGLDLVVDPQFVIHESDFAISPTHVLGIQDIQTRFSHYYQYNGIIDLTNIDDGTTSLDVYVRGAWSHPNEFPENANWTVKVKPANPDSTNWYYATNPWGETPNTNYVFSDAPEDFTLYSTGYQFPWNLTPYHGLELQFRVEFYGPFDDFNPGEKFIEFDDFFVENISYDHDIVVYQPVVPFPLSVGLLNPATVTFYNNGLNAEQFVAVWYDSGTPTPINPQPNLQPREEITVYLDNNEGDDLDGYIPSAVGAVDIYARAVLQNDQNMTNNTSETVPCDVWPMGVYEFGYDDRVPLRFYDDFVAGEGPLVHFTLQDDYPELVDSYNIQTIRMMWNGDLEDDYNFDIHVFGSGQDAPGEPIYTNTETTVIDFTYPNFQDIDVSEIANLQNITTDFWIWIEITDPTGFPHIVRSERQIVGEGHQFNYDGETVDTDYNDYFIRVIGTAEVTDNVTENESSVIPESFELGQAYPNPFNPSTTFNFKISRVSDVRIAVYNTMGQEIAVIVDNELKAGSFNATWNAANTASGMYFIRMETEGFSAVRKVMLMK